MRIKVLLAVYNDKGHPLCGMACSTIAAIPLFHEEFALAIHSDHPLAKSKAVPFERLEQLKMILFGPEHQITKVFHACCHKTGLDYLNRDRISAVRLLHPTPSQDKLADKLLVLSGRCIGPLA